MKSKKFHSKNKMAITVEPTKKVIFPRFLEMTELTLDKFWKEFLVNCATNKKIRHLNIQGDTIITFDARYKKTITKLPEDNREAFLIFQNLMKSELEVFSSNDIKVQEKKFADVHENYKAEITDWKKIGKQRLKDNLVLNYCLRLGEEYELIPKQTSQLFQLIKYALSFKQIKHTNIEIEDSRITHISGIIYDSKTKKFSIENEITPEKNTTWTCKKSRKIAEEIDVYIKQRKKNIRT